MDNPFEALLQAIMADDVPMPRQKVRTSLDIAIEGIATLTEQDRVAILEGRLRPQNVGMPLGEAYLFISHHGLMDQISAFTEESGMLWYLKRDDHGKLVMNNVVVRKGTK